MCVVSMVLDHYTTKPMEWWYPKPVPMPSTGGTFDLVMAQQKAELDAKIKELDELLARAREYDKRNGEPECEMDSKRKALKALADELGVKIKFLEDTNA